MGRVIGTVFACILVILIRWGFAQSGGSDTGGVSWGRSGESMEKLLKDKVAELTELKNVTLREKSDGSWSGQGMSSNGFVCSIDLKPEPGSKRRFKLTWTKGQMTYF